MGEPVFECRENPGIGEGAVALNSAVEVVLPMRFIVPLLTKPEGRLRLPLLAVGSRVRVTPVGTEPTSNPPSPVNTNEPELPAPAPKVSVGPVERVVPMVTVPVTVPPLSLKLVMPRTIEPLIVRAPAL